MWKPQLRDLIINPKGTHDRTLIWLPGWTRYPLQDFRVFKALNFMPNTKIRIVMAPLRKVQPGSIAPSWFQIIGNDRLSALQQIEEQCGLLDDVLYEEYNQCPNIFVGGFSQGGAMVQFLTLAKTTVPIKGLLILSATPVMGSFRSLRSDIPIFVYLGKDDEIIDFNRSRVSFMMTFTGLDYEIHSEKGLGHQYSYKQFKTIREWILKQSLSSPKL